TRLEAVSEVPTPLLALDVQRGGMPGQPGAKTSRGSATVAVSLMPLHDDLDRVGPVVGQRPLEVVTAVPMGDHLRDVIAPPEVGPTEVVNGSLKMIAGGIDAAQHDLVSEYKVANQCGPLHLERSVTSRQAGEYVHAVEFQRIQQVEFERCDSSGIDNQIERADFVTEVCRTNLTSVDVLSVDPLEPSWARRV